MKRGLSRTIAPHVAPLAFLLAACPSPDPAANPPVLWLALDGRETEVKLAEEEPEPF